MKNNLKYIIGILLVLSACMMFYNYKTSTYITAEFKDLRPFHNRAPVYYNGYQIGNVVSVKPNEDYTTTIVKMKLTPKDLKLPSNITVNLKKEKNFFDKKFDYIDIVLPEKASLFMLKNGDKVSGKSSVDVESILSNQDGDSIDEIKEEIHENLKNLNSAIIAAETLLETMNSTLTDVKPNIVASSVSLKTASENFANLSSDVNSSLSGKKMEATTANIQATTKNVKLMTNALNQTMPQISNSICEFNRILSDVESITSGMNCTMQKPFGGLRMIFGSPVSHKKCHCR